MASELAAVTIRDNNPTGPSCLRRRWAADHADEDVQYLVKILTLVLVVGDDRLLVYDLGVGL